MSERYTIARITHDGEHFEILTKPEPALSYRLGKTVPVSQVLATETIFTDAGKGTRASEETLQQVFGTTDPLKIAGVILKKGTLQLTTEQRKKLLKKKGDKSFPSYLVSALTQKQIFPTPHYGLNRQ
jgi:ribosome maturation protein SDO1